MPYFVALFPCSVVFFDFMYAVWLAVLLAVLFVRLVCFLAVSFTVLRKVSASLYVFVRFSALFPVQGAILVLAVMVRRSE